MSDPQLLSTTWPAARPAGINPIQHPAWEQARNAVLDLAAEGPVTAVIVGEPGTGKTWLLRELASALGDHGFPTMMLMQGNLPMSISSGAALLVDEASLMSAETRAQMSTQQNGVVVLAGVDWSEDDLDPAVPGPVIIPLRLLQPDEIAAFAAKWLQRSGLPDAAIGADLLSRLTAGSGGRVRTIVQLLGEAATTWQNSPLPEDTKETLAEEPLAAPAPYARPRRRGLYRPLLAGSAIAAMIALGWALMPVPPPTKIAQSPAPPSALADAAPPAASPLPPLRQAETPLPEATVTADAAALATSAPAPPSLPPLRHAEIPDPALVTAATPAEPSIAAPPLVAPPSPELHAAYAPPDTTSTAPLPDVAAASSPPPTSRSEPTVIASLDPLASPAGGPGLVLLAQRGDTLQGLYSSIYRYRRAPPFATVLAANPRPLKPGAILVFPEPPGGWRRVQR